MALSASELQSRITALRKARDSGVLLVRHGDETTQFRSLAEMDSILRQLERELDAVEGATPKARLRYIRQNSRGF